MHGHYLQKKLSICETHRVSLESIDFSQIFFVELRISIKTKSLLSLPTKLVQNTVETFFKNVVYVFCDKKSPHVKRYQARDVRAQNRSDDVFFICYRIVFSFTTDEMHA